VAALGVRNSAVLGIALAVCSCAQSSSVLQRQVQSPPPIGRSWSMR
jgi:hypothetical protein